MNTKTGLEYPEAQSFVRKQDNITILQPKKTFSQVIEDHGYPVISKEISERIHNVRSAKLAGKDLSNLTAYQKMIGKYIDGRNGKLSPFNSPKYLPLISTPMAFWTEQDILQYRKSTGGSTGETGNLKCSGCDRTGCVYCAYGAHMENPVIRDSFG